MRGQITFDALDPTRSQALFDETQRYRYWLARIWDADQPIVNFIMLNPSTADQYQSDPLSVLRSPMGVRVAYCHEHLRVSVSSIQRPAFAAE